MHEKGDGREHYLLIKQGLSFWFRIVKCRVGAGHFVSDLSKLLWRLSVTIPFIIVKSKRDIWALRLQQMINNLEILGDNVKQFMYFESSAILLLTPRTSQVYVYKTILHFPLET